MVSSVQARARKLPCVAFRSSLSPTFGYGNVKSPFGLIESKNKKRFVRNRVPSVSGCSRTAHCFGGHCTSRNELAGSDSCGDNGVEVAPMKYSLRSLMIGVV